MATNVSSLIPRVHIIGPPRSGTTLMLELMNIGFGFGAVVRNELSLFVIPAGLESPAPLLSKRPQDHHFVRHVLPIDRRQWFISLVRDPRDVIVSRHGARPDVYWANLRQWRTWYENTRDYRTHPQLIEVRYEDLVTDPDAVQQAIATRLRGLPRTQRFSEYERFAQPSEQSLQALRSVRPIDRSSIGNWRQHLPRIAGQIEVHGPIDDVLIEFGYEADASWTELLRGVEPDKTPGRWSEHSKRPASELKAEEQEQLAAYLRWRGLSSR